MEEYDGQDRLKAAYVHSQSVDRPIKMLRDTNGDGVFQITEQFYYHANHQGSISEITDYAGTVVKTYTYTPFGRIVQEGGSLENPFTFTAREYDKETGLYYYRARYYDPQTGRFLSQDCSQEKNYCIYN